MDAGRISGHKAERHQQESGVRRRVDGARGHGEIVGYQEGAERWQTTVADDGAPVTVDGRD
jgi:hypothetical protein